MQLAETACACPASLGWEASSAATLVIFLGYVVAPLALAVLLTEIRPLGEFATWRAAHAVGDHDLNSFRVRLEPLEPAGGLAPGMTVRLVPAP